MMQESHSTLLDRISELKLKRNAVILAHNYQLGEVQDIADFVGDSLELSQNAARTKADVIVFCGVHFMAETASILSPDKTVLLPDLAAGCPMANMINADDMRQLKDEHPDGMAVCYINTSAEVKAECHFCCTSANAVRVVQAIDAREIIFVPDQYLGAYVSQQTGRDMILWPGYCPTHARIRAADIRRLRNTYPAADILVHPECRPEVIELADHVLSTGGMIRHAKATHNSQMIIGTEIGIIHRLRKENPGKTFIPVSEQAVCPRMKLITLESILWSLEDLSPEVRVPEEIRLKARRAVDRMLEVA